MARRADLRTSEDLSSVRLERFFKVRSKKEPFLRLSTIEAKLYLIYRRTSTVALRTLAWACCMLRLRALMASPM